MNCLHVAVSFLRFVDRKITTNNQAQLGQVAAPTPLRPGLEIVWEMETNVKEKQSQAYLIQSDSICLSNYSVWIHVRVHLRMQVLYHA